MFVLAVGERGINELLETLLLLHDEEISDGEINSATKNKKDERRLQVSKAKRTQGSNSVLSNGSFSMHVLYAGFRCVPRKICLKCTAAIFRSEIRVTLMA